MITVTQYWMGRDKSHAAECTAEVRANANETVSRVNELLALAAAAGVAPGRDQITGTAVASGWRPAGVNARTANAAARSTHLTGEGCDLQDQKDRRLAVWCLKNLAALEMIGLWMECPRFTGGTNNADPWVHLQTRAPGSGRRVFAPGSAPPGDPQFYARHGLAVP